MNKFCKILISYHQPAPLLNDDIFIPIQTGRSEYIKDYQENKIPEQEYKWMMDNTTGDDTGENISQLGSKLCEFTTIYWAWKNYNKLGNPDYIGFMHYRRHFIFKDIKEFPNNYKNVTVSFEHIDNTYFSKIGYSKQLLKNILQKNNLITINTVDDGMTIYEHHKKYHNVEEIDYCLNLIENEYPEIYPYAMEYINQNNGYYCNMFIMKREDFFKYCKFLFNIAFKFINHTDYRYYSAIDARTFVLEKITGIFLYYLSKQNNIRIKTFPISYIENTNIIFPIMETFKQNNIPVIFTGDDDYIKYTGVAINSLIEHASSNNNYDIYIISAKISAADKDKILYMAKGKPNISIKFIDFNKYKNMWNVNTSLIYDNSRFSGGTFYRLWIPKIFDHFDKILYLDSDIIINKDISELYNEDISNYLVGGTYDIELIRLIYKENPQSTSLINYLKTHQFNNPYAYTQAGVLLFNIKEMNKFKFFEKSFNLLCEKGPLFNKDQDVINFICRNKIKYFSLKWNVEWHSTFFNENLKKTLPAQFYTSYMDSRKDPYILHYSSIWKPWKEPERELSQYFWEYAKKSPFYEIILYENFKNSNMLNTTENEISYIKNEVLGILYNWHNYTRNKFRYFKYKLLSKIMIGDQREKYKNKRKKYKSLIKITKNILKK